MDNQLTLYGLLLISLFSWLQYYPVNCIRHVYWAATPMIGMVPYSVLSMTPYKKTRIQNQIICLVLVSIFGLDISYRIYSGFNRITKHNIRIEEPLVLRGMYATPYKERLCRNMSNAIEKDVNKNTFPYILTLSNDPLYITFIGPQYNYHPMYVDWSPLNEYIYPDFKRRRDLFIEKNNPVILGFNDTPIPGAICVDTFNVYGFRQQSKLALYIFEDKKQHNLLGQNAVIGEL